MGSQSVPPVEQPGVTAAQLRAFNALESRTEAGWRWVQHDDFRTPTALTAAKVGPAVLKQTESAAVATTKFVGEYKDLFKMRDPSAELRHVSTTLDDLSMTRVRFQQVTHGIPVVGAEFDAHYDAQGRIAAVFANYIPGIDSLDLEPKLDAAEGAKLAIADVMAQAPDLEESALVKPEGKLVVFALNQRTPTLAYEYEVRALEGASPAIWVTTIDAKTGEIVDRYNNLQTVEASGKSVLDGTKTFEVTQSGNGYQMSYSANGVQVTTYSARNQQTVTNVQLITSTSLTTWDTTAVGAGAAVDAHVNAGIVADYYKKVHTRSSLDGNGGPMRSIAHYGNNYDNAFWDGQQMAYGDGGRLFRPLAAGLDVCAHEFTHGVTSSTSNLRYQGQSGALNEAVSDIFGVMVEHYAKPDATKNWLMGEAIGLNGKALRDFMDPAKGDQPAHMSRYVNTQQDGGGVHTNSGIINNAAYLMTVGGTNTVSNVQVKYGIGFEKSEKLWYRANTTKFQSTTNFAQAAAAVIQSAKELQFTENEQNIVECAFKATGIVQGDCATLTNPQSTETPGAPTGDPSNPTPGSPSTGGTSTGGDDGTTGADDPDSTDNTSATTKPKRQTLVPTQAGGCNATGAGADFGPLAGFLAAALGLASSRRKRNKG